MKRILSTSFLAMAIVIPVFAAKDDFDGYSGSLFGKAGGSNSGNINWVGNWTDGGFGQSAGLVQNSLGSVNGFSSSAPYAEFALTGGSSLESFRTFTLQQNQSEVWVYGLVSAGKSGGFQTANSFGGIGLYNAGTEKFLLGERFSQGNWGVATNNLNGAGQDSSVAIGNFNVALLVAKINQLANTLTFWVNPDFNLLESSNTPAFTLNYGTGDDSFDAVRLRGGLAGTGNIWQFDNVNVTQASPFIPEPGSAALLMLAGAVLGMRRVRRQAT